ncbi:MAG: glycosyltransferase [Cyanobacteria bacterium J06650_10]
MTVAIIANYLGPKLGIGQYIDQLIQPLVQALRQESIDVVILGSPNAVEKTPSLQKLNALNRPNGTPLLRVLPQLDESPAKRYAWFALRFNRYCRDAGISRIVWLSNPIVMPWHPTTLAVLHDVNEWKADNKYGSRLKTALRSFVYLDTSLNYAKKIVAISQATERDVLHFRPKQAVSQKLVVILNGADSQLKTLKPVDIPYPQNPFILSVGRIDPAAKRLPEAVKLVSAMRELSDKPWELHIMGGMNASTQSSGKAFLTEVESLSWVQYHGHVDDAVLAEWYRHTDAVVFLSDNEGFGFPIAEAACFNRWAIVSHRNIASSEAGSDALITVDADHPKKAAKTVINQLQQGDPPAISLPSWQDAAVAYTKEISNL